MGNQGLRQQRTNELTSSYSYIQGHNICTIVCERRDMTQLPENGEGGGGGGGGIVDSNPASRVK